jgi:hypothetical protein
MLVTQSSPCGPVIQLRGTPQGGGVLNQVTLILAGAVGGACGPASRLAVFIDLATRDQICHCLQEGGTSKVFIITIHCEDGVVVKVDPICFVGAASLPAPALTARHALALKKVNERAAAEKKATPRPRGKRKR